MFWIDITNAPHVRLFRNFINEHEDEVIVTTRRFNSLEAMLRKERIKYKVVGSHGGATKEQKLLESARRVAGLAKIISNSDVHVAIAKHSVELPRVAYGLGIPVLQIVDNEHAEKQNRLFLLLCSRVIIPDVLDKKKLIAQGAEATNIRTFHGLCEYEHVRNFEPHEDALGKLEPDAYILVRPSAEYAAYFHSDDKTQEVVNALAKRGFDVAAIPRGNEKYKNAVNIRNTDTLSLIYFAKAMVGGGGTMNREGALLGTPTISYYPQELLGVDGYLVKKGLMYHCKSISEVTKSVEKVTTQKPSFRKKARILRASMQSPIQILEKEIKSLS